MGAVSRSNPSGNPAPTARVGTSNAPDGKKTPAASSDGPLLLLGGLGAEVRMVRDNLLRSGSGPEAENHSTGVIIGGPSPLDEGPGATIAGKFLAPTGLSRVQSLFRVGFPIVSVLGFGLSAEETIRNWRTLSPLARGLNVTGTALLGGAAAAAMSPLFGASMKTAMSVFGPLSGLGGTLFAALGAVREFSDPQKSAGQRGMALANAACQGVGLALMFTPLAPVGIGLMIGGGMVLGMAGDQIGQIPVVNRACKSIGDFLGQIFGAHGAKQPN